MSRHARTGARGAGTRAAWIRYGAEAITPEELRFAVEHYRAAILQPWEVEAAAYLKVHNPGMTVLAYKCLSSTRDYEPGPVYSSGVSYQEAPEQWFAHRLDGERIQWNNYGGHWQMQVWNPEYRERWVANVVQELKDSPFDGVMADNDVFDDYYGIQPPVQGAESMEDFRTALDQLVTLAGHGLRGVDKILVPNIAESRRDPGKWERHSRFGGGFEEVWLGWEPEYYFPAETVLEQAQQLHHDSLFIGRVPSDDDDEHPNFRYAAAAMWVFGADRDAAVTATDHDSYDRTPWLPELAWDLGAPVGHVSRRWGTWSRRFEQGWAAVNFRDNGRAARVRVPEGLVDAQGRPAPQRITLRPREGALFRVPEA